MEPPFKLLDDPFPLLLLLTSHDRPFSCDGVSSIMLAWRCRGPVARTMDLFAKEGPCPNFRKSSVVPVR